MLVILGFLYSAGIFIKVGALHIWSFFAGHCHMISSMCAIGLLYTLCSLRGIPFNSYLQELVLEKETRLRESMKMMGLKGSVLWCAWFVKQFLFLFFIGIIITILLKVYTLHNSTLFLFTCHIFGIQSCELVPGLSPEPSKWVKYTYQVKGLLWCLKCILRCCFSP